MRAFRRARPVLTAATAAASIAVLCLAGAANLCPDQRRQVTVYLRGDFDTTTLAARGAVAAGAVILAAVAVLAVLAACDLWRTRSARREAGKP